MSVWTNREITICNGNGEIFTIPARRDVKVVRMHRNKGQATISTHVIGTRNGRPFRAARRALLNFTDITQDAEEGEA